MKKGIGGGCKPSKPKKKVGEWKSKRGVDGDFFISESSTHGKWGEGGGGKKKISDES